MSTRSQFDAALITTIVIAVLSLAMSAWVSYAHNDKDLTSRVTAVETQQKNDHEGMQRVDGKLDKLDEKVNKLVEWALGKQ